MAPLLPARPPREISKWQGSGPTGGPWKGMTPPTSVHIPKLALPRLVALGKSPQVCQLQLLLLKLSSSRGYVQNQRWVTWTCQVNSAGLYKGRWVSVLSPGLFPLFCFSWWKIKIKKQVFHLHKVNASGKSGKISSFNLGQSARLSFVYVCGQEPGEGFIPDIWGRVLFAVSQGRGLNRVVHVGPGIVERTTLFREAVPCMSSQFLLGTPLVACEVSILWPSLYF